jgi:hypothetical protein
VLSYRKGTPERKDIEHHIQKFRSSKLTIPLVIGGKEVLTGATGMLLLLLSALS